MVRWVKLAVLPKRRTDGVASRCDEVCVLPRSGQDRLADGRVYLCWDGDGEVIVKAFRDTGCEVVWDGDPRHRIEVVEFRCSRQGNRRQAVQIGSAGGMPTAGFDPPTTVYKTDTENRR